MENTLVTELRSITAAALTATTAAKRGEWREAETCLADLHKTVERVLRQLTSTEHELRGDGESRLSSNAENSDSISTVGR